MSKWFRLVRSHLIIGVASGLAVFALAGQTTRAGSITLFISEAGKLPVMVGLDFPGLEGAGTTNNTVNADKAALNATLTALGYDFNFNILGAISNAPANGISATLFLTGQVFRTTTGGPLSITIDASQNDYSTLIASGGLLTNFSTANFFGTPGGISDTGTSYFATSNAQDDKGGPFFSTAPTFGPPGGSDPGPAVAVPQTPFFSLTNSVVVTLDGDTTGGLNAPIDQFTHSTTVTAAIPEPTSVVMLGVGIPVVFMSLRWIRRRRAPVGH